MKINGSWNVHFSDAVLEVIAINIQLTHELNGHSNYAIFKSGIPAATTFLRPASESMRKRARICGSVSEREFFCSHLSSVQLSM